MQFQKNKSIFWGISLFVMLTACSSPQSDGEKAAKKSCDCINNYTESLNRAYMSFLDNFDSYSFQARIEAREKLNKALQKVEDEYEQCSREADAYYNKTGQKYFTDREKAEKFQYAYTAYNSRAETPVKVNVMAFQANIDRKIQTIIPKKPDVDKLKNDLVGRKITEGPDGYHGKNWYWEIKSPNELKEVKILGTIENKGDYIFNVHLVLQGEANQYDATVNITYVLRQYDDWTIEFIEPKKMNIVQTHKYDNCISTELWGMLGEHRYKFTNSCDVSLLIGGVTLSGNTGVWKKFSIIVDANGNASIGDMFNRIKDCKIHFIERP